MSGAAFLALFVANNEQRRAMDDEDDRRRRRMREEDDRRLERARSAQANAARYQAAAKPVVVPEPVRVQERIEDILESQQELKRRARSEAAEARRQQLGRPFPRRCTNEGCREQLNSQGDADSHGRKCRNR